MELGRALKALCDAGVDFVIVGGVAATFHGSAQVTYDLDICYSRSLDNLNRLVKALAPFAPRPRGFQTNYLSYGTKRPCETGPSLRSQQSLVTLICWVKFGAGNF